MTGITDIAQHPVAAESLTMTDFIASHMTHCRASGLSPITIRDRGELLRRLDADLPVGLIEANTEELSDWLAHPGWAPETKKTYYNHIVGFFRWISDPRREIGIDRDPSAGLIRPKVPKALPKPVTDDELSYALTHLERPWSLYAELAAYAGLRAAEIAALDRRDITERAIIVRKGKGGKDREVPTNPNLWRSLRTLPQGPIALLGSGRVMTADQMSNRTAHRLDEIGMPDVTLHRFRHWYATMLLRPRELGGAGADLLTVSQLMGHSSPTTTAIYAQITDEQRRIAVAALPVLAPAPR